MIKRIGARGAQTAAKVRAADRRTSRTTWLPGMGQGVRGRPSRRCLRARGRGKRIRVRWFNASEGTGDRDFWWARTGAVGNPTCPAFGPCPGLAPDLNCLAPPRPSSCAALFAVPTAEFPAHRQTPPDQRQRSPSHRSPRARRPPSPSRHRAPLLRGPIRQPRPARIQRVSHLRRKQRRQDALGRVAVAVGVLGLAHRGIDRGIIV